MAERQGATISRRTRTYVSTRCHACPWTTSSRSLASKYKEYNKLRGKLSAAVAPQTPSKRDASRRSTRDVQRTPKAVAKASTTTPLKRKREEELATEAIPQSPAFLSPQGPSVIGPTPQRDGIVLGLFDLLPAGTPSKSRTALGNVELNVLQTPSRKVQVASSETSLESRARGERTPLSAGKRFMLNQFVTPKKRKIDDAGTPSSTARGLATPAFLRRGNILGAIDETDETTPRPAPWKRRPLGRSLSAMIQAMKKDEEDQLDEEADIMREMEMEEAGISMPAKSKVPKILVEDSQAAMPLGPDRGLESEEEQEEGPLLWPNGQPRKAWKKKGLKRQTRRVNSEFTSILLTSHANGRQCAQTLQSPSLNQRYQHTTIQKMTQKGYQKHKSLATRQPIWTVAQSLTMQATPLTHQEGPMQRRRLKSRTRRKRARSRKWDERSRRRHMQTSGD